MKLRDILTSLLLVVAIVGVVGIYSFEMPEIEAPEVEVPAGSFSSIECAFSGNATSTSVGIGTTSTQVASKNRDRCFLSIVNDGSNAAYLAIGAQGTATSTAGEGIRLNANGGSVSWDNEAPLESAVQATVGSGTTTLSIAHY